MSGGHLDDYGYFRLLQTIDAIENLILKNSSEQINDWGEKIEPYSDVTIDRFREAVDLLKRAYIYAHRIDQLVSADDSEQDFHERLQEDQHPLSDVIRAYIDGKQIQTRQKKTQNAWTDCFTLKEMDKAGLSFPDFNNPNREWRVKPKTKNFVCRLALFKDKEGRFYSLGYDNAINRGIDDWFVKGENPPQGSNFIRWITDLIEFEVESDEIS